MEDQITNLNNKIKKSLKNQSELCKIIKWGYFICPMILVLLVFLESIISRFNFSEYIDATIIVFVFIFGLLTIIIGILNFYIQKEEEIFIGEALNYKEALEKLQNLEEDLDSIQNLSEKEIQRANGFVNFINDSFSSINNLLFLENKKESFYSKLNNLLEILYGQIEFIYESNNKQLITLAIYLYDKEEQTEYKLKPYLSKKPSLMDKGRGRWWKPGDGQVGLTFLKKQPYNFNNIHTQINPTTLNYKENDKINYISAISVPLFINPTEKELDNKTARGVFCITSNLESAFLSEENALPQEEIAYKIKETCTKIVASIIELQFNEVFGQNLTSDPFQFLPEEDKKEIEEGKFNKQLISFVDS